MAYHFLINSLVNLIIGASLVLAWRRHREQVFLRALGLATLLQVLMPPASCGGRRPPAPRRGWPRP